MSEETPQTEVWGPQPGPQTEILRRTEDELLMGGSRGGGKSEAGQLWMIEPKYIEHPRYRGLVLRITHKDLSDWIDRARHRYEPLGAVFKGNPEEIIFPSGAKILTGYLKDETSFEQYKGHEYQKILIEELTQIVSERSYEKILSANRSSIPELKPQILSTTNPDGPGHTWVKNRFITAGEPGKTIRIEDDETGYTLTRIFIPATIDDNPKLKDNDPRYVSRMNSLKHTDPELYKQWRKGDWTSFKVKGSVYAHNLDMAQNQGRIKEFTIDPNIPVNTLWDLGVNDMCAIWFYQIVDNTPRFIYYYETSNKGFRDIYNDLQGVATGYNFVYGRHYLPHDARQREISTGITRIDTLRKLFGEGRVQTNVPERARVPSLADGIHAVKNIISVSIFHEENCKLGLDRLRMYRREYDETLGVFKKEPKHDINSHGADALRTGCTILRPGEIEPEGMEDMLTFEDIAEYAKYDYYKENPKELRKLYRKVKRANRKHKIT